MGKIIITRSVHQRMPPTKEAVKFKIIIIIIIIIIVIIIIIMLIIIIINNNNDGNNSLFILGDNVQSKSTQYNKNTTVTHK